MILKRRVLAVGILIALCSGSPTVNAQKISTDIPGVQTALKDPTIAEVEKMVSEKTDVMKLNNKEENVVAEKKKEKKSSKKKKSAKKEESEKIYLKKEKKEESFEAEFLVTAYCPCEICSEGYGRQTCTGVYAEEGRTVAVDKSVIPYGSTVIINDHEYIAEDRGGDIVGHRIDIYMDDHDRTKVWGEKNLKVKVIKKIEE